jgi:heterodisulfide reductase subunit A-like polyferredoxin
LSRAHLDQQLAEVSKEILISGGGLSLFHCAAGISAAVSVATRGGNTRR